MIKSIFKIVCCMILCAVSTEAFAQYHGGSYVYGNVFVGDPPVYGYWVNYTPVYNYQYPAYVYYNQPVQYVQYVTPMVYSYGAQVINYDDRNWCRRNGAYLGHYYQYYGTYYPNKY